ncbi:hypothetical protein JHK82_015536 [Glycine max]|nr:hypothetical protein JHK82_015536 [Glycine max]
MAAKLDTHAVASDLIDFLNASPTAFHAVGKTKTKFSFSYFFLSPKNRNKSSLTLYSFLSDEAKRRLRSAGYHQLSEREVWELQPGNKYFFTRNHSTIVAFAIGKKYVAGNGFYIIGAHTDSPCLKLKPVTKVVKAGILEVGVQTYGGGLWHTWFDRDLTVAGRVIVREENAGSVSYSHRLVRIEEPIMRIPTLAIHLDKTVNDGFKFNNENHLIPILATSLKGELNKVSSENGPVESGNQTDGKKANDKTGTSNTKHHLLLLQYSLGTRVTRPCHPEQANPRGGMLWSVGVPVVVIVGFIRALIDATSSDSSLEEESGVRMVALFDHEEVGSNSAQGAGSPVMLNAVTRVTNSFSSNPNLLEKAAQLSYLVSADMAHALHPNYMDKHEANHQPKLHGGLVIKTNASQRYATNVVTSFIFREIASKHKLPVQDFVVRNDMSCGSTIGPILASGVGIRTVDVGAPQLSMHSIREICAVDDVKYSYEHFKAFYQEFSHVDGIGIPLVITESLKRCGISDSTTYILATRFDASPDEIKAIGKLINGKEIDLEELEGRANLSQIQKLYKISSSELGVSSLADAISCRIAACDAL